MSDDWWAKRIKEWPGAKKFREKSLANMDLVERIYGSAHISGAECWSAQQGEEQLDSIMPEELINEFDVVSDSRQTAPPPTQAGNAPSSFNKSRANKKRRVSHEVADAIRDSSHRRYWPTLLNDRRYWPYFAYCIGALDGTHVPIRPPSHNVEPFMGRKGEATMNVGVSCRAHDTKVLTYCATQEPFFLHPPNEKYYLVDLGYPTRVGYLGLHRKTRYHLDQFNRGRPPTNTRELFNRKHSGLRSVIERTFGVWKAKWRILDQKHPKYELNKWVKIVTATMALHNFIRDSHNDDCDFVH